MNKDQAVLWMIAGVFTVVAVFLYFVFRTDHKQIAEQTQDTDSAYTAEIGEDVLSKIASETAEDKIDAAASTISTGERAPEMSQSNNVPAKTNNISNSPQTGPGAVVAMIASGMACIVSLGVFLGMREHADVA